MGIFIKVYAGVDLSSREAALRVLLALMSLTSVFGMGTGVPSSSLTPAYLYSTPKRYYLPYSVFLVVTRKGIEPLFSP